MSEIKQEHEHIISLRWKDGKQVKKCLHHECDYEEEVKPWEPYENDM